MEVYKYINTRWKYKYAANTKQMISPFLSDYFDICENDKVDSDFSVELYLEEFRGISKILERGKEVLIHNSQKPLFHDTGKFLDVGCIRYVYNFITKSVYEVNYLSKVVRIFNRDVDMLSRDGVRVLRDFVKVSVEDKGAVMYHASAIVSDNDECIMLIGEKGRGKTTISLKAIYEYGFYELSRDRVYLTKENNKLMVNGWPTYYNLTMKTLKHFDETKFLLPKKYSELSDDVLNNIKTKLQLVPNEIGIYKKKKKAQLTHLIYLLKEGEKCYEKDIIAKNCFSPNDTYSTNWHGIDIDRRKIISNVRELSNNLYKFDNVIYLEVNKDINKTMEKLLKAIGR